LEGGDWVTRRKKGSPIRHGGEGKCEKVQRKRGENKGTSHRVPEMLEGRLPSHASRGRTKKKNRQCQTQKKKKEWGTPYLM